MDETQRSAQRAKSVAERLGATDVDLWIFSPRSPDVLLNPQKFSVLMQTIRMQMRGQLFCVDCDELINEPTDIGVVAYMTAARREVRALWFRLLRSLRGPRWRRSPGPHHKGRRRRTETPGRLMPRRRRFPDLLDQPRADPLRHVVRA